MLRRLALALTLVLATVLAPLPVAAPPAAADSTYQTLPFSQNWSNTSLITTSDDWSGVPGIIGYRGDNITAATGADPQTLLGEGTVVVNVNVNQGVNITSTTGGVSEFDGLANPVVALQGSGTADAPYLQLHLDTTGWLSVTISYNVRDIDSTTDNTNQQVALQYRVGESGSFTNVPAGYIADATSGPSLATLVTPITVTLPVTASNQSQLQVRIITSNAASSDEWVGIDDLLVTGFQEPDLSVLKTGPLLADPGDTITYTLSVANLGNLTGAAARLTDTLPSQVSFVTFTSNSLVTFTQPAAQALAWELGDLAADDTVTITVEGAITNTAPVGLTITNVITATTATTETITSNNSASLNTFIGAPNLAVDKTGPTGDVLAGTQVTFTLAYANSGNYLMSPVTLEDTLPSGLTFVSASGAGFHSNGTVTWLLGALGTGVSGTVTLTATASAAGTYTNSVLIYGPGVPETNTNDNRDSLLVTIIGSDPYVTKTGPATLQQGKRVTYTVGYGNNGQISATVTLTDTLPAGFDVSSIAFDDSGLAIVDGLATRTWLAGTVPGNTHFTFTLALTMPLSVVQGTVFTNTLTLTTTAAGDEAGNNSAQFATTVLAPDPCESAFIEISALQGPTATTPYFGQAVTTRGIVVGDYQGSSNLSGYFLQDEDGGDANPATSEGLFVFNNSFPVSLGDLVVASGTITEFNTLTELATVTTVTVCGTGHALAPTVIDLPAASLGDHERYEGMYVTIPETLTAQQNFFQGRYGQVTLAADGRLYNPTNGNGLGEDLDTNTRRMLVLDDGSNAQNPNPIPYIGLDNTLRAGDVVSGLTGLLDYGQINSDFSIRFYRLHPTAPVTFTRLNARPSVPDDVGGELRVGSFNVLNYFNGDGLGGGFPTSRGADDLNEFIRQEAKIITALVALDADVVGLMEIENDGTGAQSAIQALVDRLNEETAPGTYAFVAEPDPGTDAIKVALIYQPASVTPVGLAVNYQVTDHITYTGELFDRTPLAQTFQDNLTGQTFTVVVNHFKSKGSCPGSGPDTDQGDGQGCWNAKRVAQAAALLDFIADLQADTGDPDVIVIGDLNSYGAEDPIDTLTNGGLVNQVAQHVAAAERYSYIFDGFSGYLDHGLSTPSLDPYITGVTYWHINADEPSVIDYNTEFKPQDLYAPDQFRASDHDPVLIGLDLPFPADLSGSSKTVNTTSITGGDLLTYTLTISNSGELTVTYQLTDVLDANLSLISAPGLSGTTTLTGTGMLAGYAQQAFVVTVQASITFSGTVNNTAQLTGDGQLRNLAAPAVTVAQYIYRLFLPLIMK